ncbi:MAG TPA: hypothetical protein DIT13_09595 [Verrucomicrobiales bacterium]|nr:hypothetical protein [Verrucomicrobiales bacterium]HRJ08232.1 protein kinase [Prosthecobacter sp.]HRK16486.1 protein kinase [Prosthecobacter sp.]
MPSQDSKLLHGLDPAALFSLADEAAPAAAGGAWEPPGMEEVAALFPQWQAKGLLGRGGMGAVYHFHQSDLARDVAVKLLPIEASADERQVERFRREARALARLRHPNIVALHEAGITPAGHFFFVMEYVDGQPLSRLIAGGKMDAPRAIEVVRQVCDALACAHGQGVIHRDIKPSNILINSAGQVKVADFGLARLDHAAEEDALTLSRTGAFMGTPAYTAPEQARDAAHADHRADIYSLGVLLYEMLTGELPRGVFQPPSRKAGSDARLDSVVRRALQERPEDRYQAAAELKEDVTESASRPAADTSKAPAPWRAWAALLIVCVVVAAAALVFFKQAPESKPDQHAPMTAREPQPKLPEPASEPPKPEAAQSYPAKKESPPMPAPVSSPETRQEPPSPGALPPQFSKVHVWSLDPVPPALYPPASTTGAGWKDAVLIADGGAALLHDGSIIIWSDREPGKGLPIVWPPRSTAGLILPGDRKSVLAEPIVRLTATATDAVAWAESGAAFLLPREPGAGLRRLLPAEAEKFPAHMDGRPQSDIQGSKPAGLSSQARVIQQEGIWLGWESDGKATLWGPRISDSPQRFRLPEGVTQVRLGPTGLMAAW